MQQVSLSKLFSKQILLAMLASLLVSLPVTFIPAYFIAQANIENQIEYLETTTYQQVEQHLSTGWQKHNTDKVLDNLRQEVPYASFYLLKSPQFLDENESTPTIHSPQLQRLISDVEQSKQQAIEADFFNSAIYAAYPVKFNDSCLKCHAQEVDEGVIYSGLQAGIIAYKAPYTIATVSTGLQIAFFILFIIISITAVLYLAKRSINEQVLTPLQELSQRIATLKFDSQQLEGGWQRTPQAIDEIDRIDEELSKHIHLIQNIYSKLDALIITEHESGLFHRERFNEVIQYELARAKRYQHPFSVVVIKLLSATPHDPQAYATLPEKERQPLKIQAFSQLLSADVRTTDLVFRINEEVFVIIAPETGAENIEVMVGHLSETLKSSQDIELEGVSCTFEFDFNIGHACFDEDGSTAKQLMHEAALRMKGG